MCWARGREELGQGQATTTRAEGGGHSVPATTEPGRGPGEAAGRDRMGSGLRPAVTSGVEGTSESGSDTLRLLGPQGRARGPGSWF